MHFTFFLSFHSVSLWCLAVFSLWIRLFWKVPPFWQWITHTTSSIYLIYTTTSSTLKALHLWVRKWAEPGAVFSFVSSDCTCTLKSERREKRSCLLLFIRACALFIMSVISQHKLGHVDYQPSEELWTRTARFEALPRMILCCILEWLSVSVRECSVLMKLFYIYSWMIFACQIVKDPGKGQETAHMQQLCPKSTPQGFLVVIRCLIMSPVTEQF